MTSKPRRLTHDGRRKIRPVFTAGGEQIVYAVHEAPNLVAIERLKLADGSVERVHPDIAAHQFDPAYSPDGRWHAYIRSQGAPQLVLVIQDTQAQKEYVFSPQDSRATARCPAIAPDASRVIFSVSDVRGHQIASVNMQAGDLKLLTESAGLNCWPAFSPDGTQIAFGSSRAGSFDLYCMNADGSEVRRLTESAGRDMHPAWSPDGKRLAFVRPTEGNYDIYLIGADGSAPSRLTDHPERDDFPAWHPDGRHILTVSERAGRCDLYLFDALAGA